MATLKRRRITTQPLRAMNCSVRRILVLSGLCLLIASIGQHVLQAGDGPAGPEDGFRSLFDGQTLNGWMGAVDGYLVEDGAITCDQKKGGNLLTKEEFADFVLRLEFRTPPGGNNGIALRAPPQGHVATLGFEIQTLDTEHKKYANIEAWQAHGSIYGLVAAKRGYLKEAGQWNTQEIRCLARRIAVVLNGETIVDADLDAATANGTLDGKEHPGLARTHGHVGFLGHGDRVQYRNIRIKVIHPLDPLVWERRSTELDEPIMSVESLDTNGDGHRELIAIGPRRVWAIPGYGATAQAHLIAEHGGGSAIHAIALDCDADGDQDLAIGRPGSEWIAHREKLAKGEPSTEPMGPDYTVGWIENVGAVDREWPLHILDRELHGVHGVWKGDVNGDGVDDLLADSFDGPHLKDSLAWFPSPKTPPDQAKSDFERMPRFLITRGAATGRAHYMGFGDINRDGRGDVLLGASLEGSFTWWEQPAELTQDWPRHVIDMVPGATHTRVADLNGDGRLDVLASAGHGTGILWYEQPAELTEPWIKHSIDEQIQDTHSFDSGDLDGDGDIDCAGCSYSQRIVRWWENTGAGQFVQHDLDVGRRQEAYDLKLADLDGDGRVDVLLAGRSGKNAVWYRNLRGRE